MFISPNISCSARAGETLDQRPDATDVPINLPADATDVVVAKVRFVERPSWIGGRQGEGMTNDILFTRVKSSRSTGAKPKLTKYFMSEWDCETTIEILPNRTRPINVVKSTRLLSTRQAMVCTGSHRSQSAGLNTLNGRRRNGLMSDSEETRSANSSSTSPLRPSLNARVQSAMRSKAEVGESVLKDERWSLPSKWTGFRSPGYILDITTA
jgi:hypothetical protein